MLMSHFFHIEGTDIFYREENPDGIVTLFLLHGNSSSHHCWDTLIKNEALKTYRIIAFDLPAHGQSGTGGSYSLKHTGAVMAKVVSALTNDKPYVLAGVSLGTNVIAEMLNSNTIDPVGIALIGSCIVGGNIKIEDIALPGTKIGVCFADSPSGQDIAELFKQGVFNLNDTLLSALIADFGQVKDSFRSKLSAALADGQYSNEIELLNQKENPLLFCDLRSH